MTSDRGFVPVWVVLTGMLALSAGLMLMPRRVSVGLRGGFGAVLEPGQGVAAGVVRRTESGVRALAAARSTAREMEQLRAELHRVEGERRQLEQRLQAIADDGPLRRASRWAEVRDGEPLLVPRIQVARVLGQSATAFLGRDRVLNLGSRDGIVGDAMVLDGADEASGGELLIDQGASAGLQGGFGVLWGRVVLGRIVEVGPHTSRVQMVRDAGFRAAARLARRTDQGLRWGAAGVLQGTGGALCRLEHVGARRPVEVGDLVVTAGHAGVLPQPLLYGRVQQCLLQPGGSTWEIWVRPASVPPRLGRVLVLTAQLNAERVRGRSPQEQVSAANE